MDADRNHWFCRAVRKRRRQLGLSTAELASLAGIHFRTLQEIETGSYFPADFYLEPLLKTLETDVIRLRDIP